MMKRPTPVATAFLLISDPKSPWALTITNVLASLGELRVISEKEVTDKTLQAHYDLIVVDANVVERVIHLVAELHNQKPEARIVVATLSPTWRRAREALRAGAISYVLRSQNEEELLSTIKEILSRSIPSHQILRNEEVDDDNYQGDYSVCR